MKIEIKPEKALLIATSIVGIAYNVLSNKTKDNERKNMKAELKNELLEELLKEKGEA